MGKKAITNDHLTTSGIFQILTSAEGSFSISRMAKETTGAQSHVMCLTRIMLTFLLTQ